jgi:hypothetical protein
LSLLPLFSFIRIPYSGFRSLRRRKNTQKHKVRWPEENCDATRQDNRKVRRGRTPRTV